MYNFSIDRECDTMILRRPYAFLIKYFRLIHLIITGILIFLVSASNSIYSYLNSCVDDSVNRYIAYDYINYGLFINTLISFILVSFCVFLLIKVINRLKNVAKTDCEKVEEVTTKDCPYCFTTIDIRATKCPNCTSDIQA